MRSLLITGAAVAVVASTAAAANFDVNDADGTLDDVSSGVSPIEDCTSGLEVDVLHSTDYDDTINDWYVTGVRVTGASSPLLSVCDELALAVALDGDNGTPTDTADDVNQTVLGPVVLDDSSVVGSVVELAVPAGILVAAGGVDEVSLLVEKDLAAATALAAARLIDRMTADDRTTDVVSPSAPVNVLGATTHTSPALPLRLWSSTTPYGTGGYSLSRMLVIEQAIVTDIDVDPLTQRLVVASNPDGSGSISANDGILVNGTKICSPGPCGGGVAPVDVTAHVTGNALVIEWIDFGAGAAASDAWLVAVDR